MDVGQAESKRTIFTLSVFCPCSAAEVTQLETAA